MVCCAIVYMRFILWHRLENNFMDNKIHLMLSNGLTPVLSDYMYCFSECLKCTHISMNFYLFCKWRHGQRLGLFFRCEVLMWQQPLSGQLWGVEQYKQGLVTLMRYFCHLLPQQARLNETTDEFIHSETYYTSLSAVWLLFRRTLPVLMGKLCNNHNNSNHSSSYNNSNDK